MLADSVITPSNAEWASPIVVLHKKGGKLRLCVDYRRLSAVTQRDSCPIPRLDEFIDSLGDARIFTTLDCNRGYWQVEADERYMDKTTFTYYFGL